MNSNVGTWYDELYRIFADKRLLSLEQTIKLGQCLRLIQSGANAEYHLNELYYQVRDNKVLAEALDEYIHAYIKNRQEVIVDDNDNEESETGWITIQAT